MNLNSKENSFSTKTNTNKIKNKPIPLCFNKMIHHSLYYKGIKRKPQLKIIKLNDSNAEALKYINIDYAMDSILVDKLFKYKKICKEK